MKRLKVRENAQLLPKTVSLEKLFVFLYEVLKVHKILKFLNFDNLESFLILLKAKLLII